MISTKAVSTPHLEGGGEERVCVEGEGGGRRRRWGEEEEEGKEGRQRGIVCRDRIRKTGEYLCQAAISRGLVSTTARLLH